MKSEYPEEYSAVGKVRREKLLARKSCFVQNKSLPNFLSNLRAISSLFSAEKIVKTK